jgi:alanine racemase
VVTLEAQVVQVRSVAAGSPVGYGGTHQTNAATRLATLGIGYADGLLRSLSNRGCVAWQGVWLPIVGRVYMDLTVVDAGVQPLAVGDWVEVFGAALPIEELAARAGTISYELLTRVGPRVARVYRN